MPFVWLIPLTLIVVTAVAAGFFAHPIETPSPTSEIPTPDATAPAGLSAEASAKAEASPESSVLGTQTSEPSPTPTPTTSPTQTPADLPAETLVKVGALAKEGPSISFLDLPNTLSAGQKTKITIKIDGPAGTKGDNAKIKVKYHASEEKNNSSSSIKTDISNSFGSFTTPATFSMNLSLGQEKAPIELTASAEINGQTIETTRTVTLN